MQASTNQPLHGTWVADFMLRQDAGRFMLGKYLSDKQISTVFHIFRMLVYSGDSEPIKNIFMLVYSGNSEAKETIGDGGGRKYANSQFSIQNRQDAISRVSTVQNSVRGPR